MFEKSRKRYLEDGTDLRMKIAVNDGFFFWFQDAIKKAHIDLDLAHILRERVVQFRNDIEPMPERRYIAEESIRYIQVSDPSSYIFQSF